MDDKNKDQDQNQNHYGMVEVVGDASHNAESTLAKIKNNPKQLAMILIVFFIVRGAFATVMIKHFTSKTPAYSDASLIGHGGGKSNNSKKPSSKTTSTSSSSSSSAKAKTNVSNSLFNSVTAAINIQNVTLLNHDYASSVHIVDLFSNVNVTLPTNQASILVATSLNGGSSPWTWGVTQSQLTSLENGPYGQYCNANSIIGISNNGYIVCISVNGDGQITSVFVAPVQTVNNADNGNSSSSGSTNNQITTNNGNGGD